MKKWTFLLIALVALAPTSLFGQAQTTGSVVGTVVNEAGAPVADAEVTLTSPAIQGERVTRTNANGQFTAHLLPAGQYTATINSPGLQPAVLSFRVLVGDTMPLNVTLYPGEVAGEEIVVLGRVSPLQTPETRQSFDYTTEVDELPIQNRNINTIALNAPNTSFGPNAGQVAIAGAPAFDTIVLLDGAEISDPYFGSGTTVWLEDSIQEVQILTTGINARYGRFQGGVINAVTKSGGNQYSGMLRFEADKESWNEKTPFNEGQADKLNKVYQATLGGFIVPDRLWFFGGFRTIPESVIANTTKTTLENYETTTNEDRYQIKLRGAITPSHTVDASYLNFDGSTSNRAGLPAGDTLALGDRLDPRELLTVSYQGVFGFNTFADAMYTDKAVQIASGGDPNGADPFLWSTAGNWVYNNHWWDITDPSVRDNQTAALNVNHNLDVGTFGNHNLQGGVQWVQSTTAGDNKQSATGYNLVGGSSAFNPRVVNGQVLFDLNPNQVTRWIATDLKATNEITNTALYVQDSMNWNKFRFDVGVRYDMYDGKTTGVQAFDLNFTDLSPRLGVTYNITPALQVLGTYGRYVGRFNDNWAGPAAGVSSAPRSIWNYIGPQQLGLTAAQAQAVLRDDQYWEQTGLIGDPDFPTTWVSDDVESPYSNEWNLSVRSALPRNSGFVSLTYTDRAYKNLMTAFVGLACSDWGRCEGGDTSAIPGGAVVDTTVWDNDPRAKRDYQGLALQTDWRPTTKLTVGGNWTWSETKGNYEGEALNQPASGSVFGSRERGLPIELAAPYGYLAQDLRHRVFGYGTYRFDFGRAGDLSTSGIINYRSGFPFNHQATVARTRVEEYVTKTGSYTHYFDGRGEFRFPSVWSLDAAFRYSVPVVWRVAPFLKLDVRNILNRDKLISHQTTGVQYQGTWYGSGNASPILTSGANAGQPNPSYLAQCDPNGGQFQPSTACTGFGRIRDQLDYQTPRTFLITAGIQF